MKSTLLAAMVLAMLPVSAHAATFAKQSLFLSKTPVTEGETVFVHAVVANDSNVKFDGDVVLKDGVTKIGTVAVSIAAGGANTVSVSWKPAAGQHTVIAELTADDGTVVESESAQFDIREKPKPASATADAPGTSTPVESSADIQKKINDISPAVGSISAPIFSTLDSVRANAAKALDSGIDWAKQKTAGKNPGQVLGTATQGGADGAVETGWTILATVLLYILSVLRFVVGNAGIFYPAFALLFFYILWRLFKRYRRPSYELAP
jgi:hypothetical protein